MGNGNQKHTQNHSEKFELQADLTCMIFLGDLLPDLDKSISTGARSDNDSKD